MGERTAGDAQAGRPAGVATSRRRLWGLAVGASMVPLVLLGLTAWTLATRRWWMLAVLVPLLAFYGWLRSRQYARLIRRMRVQERDQPERPAP